MTSTRATKIMCGVTLAVGMLLAASIKTSCSPGGAGTISIPGNKLKSFQSKTEPGKAIAAPKKAKRKARQSR
jgi:hypothetical protein